jgi:asparagine synthase (glutamine-hydrolysing)
MCGIAGYAGTEAREWLADACRWLRHRGPDAEGLRVDPGGNAGLGHRRLSILDLSAAGAQPMTGENGRFVLSYNGEIYNFGDLRRELQAAGHRFRSRSDTEVLLRGWEQWGSEVLQRLNGIFAFAIWDKTERTMYLARDPLGVKPLYWTLDAHGGLYFASELKPLLGLPHISRSINPRALEAYSAYLWIPAPETFFDGISQLEPGLLLSYGADKRLTRARYTDFFNDLRRRAQAQPARVEPEEVWNTLRACVRRQLVSDVPVGVFLSGGVDSTGIIAACAEQASNLTAYTIAFSQSESAYEATSNDLTFARQVAQHYSIPHEVLRVEANLADLLPRYLSAMDQPVGDHAPLASYLICQAASSRAKVLLSGQGADEIFAGYPWHRAAYYSFLYRKLPGWLRQHAIGPAVACLPGGIGGPWLGNLRRLKRFVRSAGSSWPQSYVGFCRYLTPQSRTELLNADFRLRRPPGETSPESIYETALAEASALTPVDQMLYTDLQTFLPGLNLFYTDRTGMAHGIEVRVPYLDLELVRLAFSIPAEQKLNRHGGKWILKEALRPHLPPAVVARRKAGFGLPVRSWMRTQLRPILADTLSETAVRARGWWDPAAVRELRQEQQSGREDRAYLLFALAALELWWRAQMTADHAPAETTAA